MVEGYGEGGGKGGSGGSRRVDMQWWMVERVSNEDW